MAFYSNDDFEPDCALGYLARRVHQAGQVALEPMFAEEGLTGIQWSALMSIWFERGSTCAALARDLAHDKGAMTRLVDTLEQRGWVTRVRDSDDRRIINLTLTDEGRALGIRCKLRVIAYWNALLKDWNEGEAQTLIALLQKLRVTMESATAQGTRA
jgi:DNA-binding MarR family transcriptional regulator